MKINDYFIESTLIQQLCHGFLTVLRKEKNHLFGIQVGKNLL